MNRHEVHPAAIPVDVLLRNCDVKRTRGSGPGGQHRNKVETAIVLTHRPTGHRAEASERRSQADNLKAAAFRMRLTLAFEVRSEPELPHDLWSGRIVRGRIEVNQKHEDYPTLLALALDVLAAQSWDPRAAAELLGVSMSQLVKFIRREPRALALVNKHRAAMDRHPLR